MAGQPLHRKRRSSGHNISMGGPPGAGKTLLARAVPSILFGRPLGETVLFEKETLLAFATALGAQTGIEVRLV